MKKAPAGAPMREWLARPIIPVISRAEPDPQSLADAGLIFVQGCELVELPGILDWLKRGPLKRTRVMVHVDLLAGLSSDDAGLRYLASLQKIDGVVTVRSHVVGAARRVGLASILLLFLQDGRSVDRGLHLIEQSRPDAVELVPGVAALETATQFEQVSIPRIAGGLIRTSSLVEKLLKARFDAVSSSNEALWRLNRQAAGSRRAT